MSSLTRVRLPWALLLVALLVTAVATPAGAQLVDERRGSPGRGVLVPNAMVAGDADATALEVNPGQLGLLDATSAALVYDDWEDGTPREGRGTGVFLALPAGGLSLGGGFQWLRPTMPGEPERYQKSQLGLGLRLGRSLGVGLVWEHLFNSRYDGLDTWGAGFGWQLFPGLAAGLAVRDLFRPRPVAGGPKVPREWDGELAVRPFGTYRLEAAVGLRYLQGADEDKLLPHGRLQARLLRGLTVFAEMETPRRRVPVIDEGGAPRLATDYRGTAGLLVSLDRVSLAGAAVGSLRSVSGDEGADEGARGPGASVGLRTYSARPPEPFIAPRHVARVKIAGLEDDRDFVQKLVQLRRLSQDPAVGAVLLEIGELRLGLGRIEELRETLDTLGRNKPIFAYLEDASTKEYYLASSCQHVVIHPAGSLLLSGLALTTTFFKGTLDKLGVNVELLRIAEYKGAMEPFVRTDSSEAVAENRDAVLDSLYARLLSGLSRQRGGRNLSEETIRKLVNRSVFTPPQAKDRQLVDEIADKRQTEEFVRKTLGKGWSVRDADPGRRQPGRWRPSRVAVILVDGAIVEGKPVGFPPSQGPVAWSQPIVDAISQVKRDGSVRAIVLRVNSPGGSAFASDRIARELQRLREETNKPVIVSMGDTAASGGYYVAAPSDAIFAPGAGITGSIGIFGFKVDVSGLLDKVGVTWEIAQRGERADLFSPYRPWTEDEREALMDTLRHSYDRFLRVVVDGRKRRGFTLERADELGRGRIYTGVQAKAVGLVDELGGFGTALDEAVRRGRLHTGADGLPEIVVLPPRPPSALATLLALRAGVSAEARDHHPAGLTADTASAALGFLRRHGQGAARLLLPLLLGKPDRVQARLPFEIEVR